MNNLFLIDLLLESTYEYNTVTAKHITYLNKLCRTRTTNKPHLNVLLLHLGPRLSHVLRGDRRTNTPLPLKV